MTVKQIVLTLALLVWPCGAKPSQGQALPTAKGPGGYVAVGVGGSLYQADYGNNDLAGGVIWIDASLPRAIGLEAEARFLRYHQQKQVYQDTYLIGPRYAFKPSHWVPYVKAPVGLGHIRLAYNYAYGDFFVVAPGGGLDYWIGDKVRVRVVDVEYQFWPQFSFGPLHPYGATAGISFRIH